MATPSLNAHNEQVPPTDHVVLERDGDFYLEDELVVLAVGNTLFKVHRFFLTRDSEVFRNLFAVPSPPDEAMEGSSDENPIHLEVPLAEFKCLLSFFYDRVNSLFHGTTEEWMMLLSISTRFVCDGIRDLAITELSAANTLGPIERIRLACQYDLKSWVAGAVLQLCKREAPLTEEETLAIGIPTALKIMAVREQAREKGYIKVNIKSHFPYEKVLSYDDPMIVRDIREFFPQN